jgi:hypothetical protein
MLLAAVLGAYISRLLMGQSVYHALTDALRQSTPAHNLT